MKHITESQSRCSQETIFISFIIPVLNGEVFLRQCLQSITALEFFDCTYEIIILDNGSTDNTHKIIHEMGLQLHVVQGLNIGALRNYGAQIAKGEMCVFMDSDVELASNWVQRGLNCFKGKDVVAIAGPRCMPHNPTWVQRVWNLHRHNPEIQDRVIPVRWHPTMAFMVRRKDFLEINGFNEALETAEDVDFGYRLSERGQLLFDPLMPAIHLGEDPDLKTFWRKEVWRGKGNIKGVYSHGFRWDEIPSLGYPIYMICSFFLLFAAMGLDGRIGSIRFSLLALIILIFPAMTLALKTGISKRHVEAIPQLFLLFLTYGFARAWAVVKVAIRF